MVTVSEVDTALRAAYKKGAKHCLLVFSHPEVAHGLTYEGIPQVNLDQLNPKQMFCAVTMGNAMEKMPRDNTFVPDRSHNGQIAMEYSRGVLNYVTKVMKLTRGKLIKGNGWKEWRQSKWKQLDQYDQQEMFGEPLKPVSWKTVFCLA